MICRLSLALFFNRALPDSIAGTSGLLISGAIQEELLFRGIILGLGVAIVRAYNAPNWTLFGVALPLSAIFFSLAHTAVVNHHPGAEVFSWLPFWERFAAGCIYGYAFLRQGLGVSTLAHLGYLSALELGLASYLR
jgi:membrane protease YdiL (CAAX protease family)